VVPSSAKGCSALRPTALIAEARDYLCFCHGWHARHMIGRAFAYPREMVTFCIYA
jgi:hypothetical protein